MSQDLSPFRSLETDLAAALGRDREEFRRRLAGMEQRARNGLPYERGLRRLRAEVLRSGDARQRRANVPLTIEYDPALPISEHASVIGQAIRENQVIIVAGETGSGKTTQLPKICLQAGRGVDGWIGCTQPRRIAARSIAARLCEELRVELGGMVGYQVRFDERIRPESLVKLMTDGILLAEAQSDRDLHAYDTLIIDEAHERSLNVDFILGYLKRLLARRPDLRVIVTSATIDTARFSAHFDRAPVIEIAGRGFPVDVRYRPLSEDESDADLSSAIAATIDELNQVDPQGDILVFLPGERDIREVQSDLGKRHYRNTEVLPLYARLSSVRQNRIFHPGQGRRIILTTNIAETSLTVPRIRFVIDSGLARMSRYSYRSKVQRLPIESISQASANQRAGRCGRLGPGICVRLYSLEDFDRRPAFTDAEIVRTNLAAVILRMADLGLGNIDAFPFLDRPDSRFVKDGYQLLFELGALDERRRLTRSGHELARWPLDVRLARLILAGHEHRCLAEAVTLAAVLAIQDPRERPLDKAQAADQAHAQWHHRHSDFVALLNLWRDWLALDGSMSHGQQRRWCREHYVSYLRMREWRDLRRQLVGQCKGLGWTINKEPADYEPLHRAIACAWLGQLGLKDDKEYLGARGQRFHIFPGSGLHGRGPKWLVCAFLMETTRVYARINARIEPEWIEQAGAHLVKRHVFDPYWSKRAGRVMGYEQVTLYGLPLVQRRRIQFGALQPRLAREIFIRDALVTGELRTSGDFAAHNRQLIAAVEGLEEKQRRRDLLVDATTLYAFFDQRLPADIHDIQGFETWRRAAEKSQPRLLFLQQDDLLQRTEHDVTEARFPDQIELNGARFEITYTLTPGKDEDGLNLRVPVHLLNALESVDLEWLVPGLLHDKVTALIKTLPKTIRRRFVPAPDWASDFVRQSDASGNLVDRLTVFLSHRSGFAVQTTDFDLSKVPPHLRININLYDGTRLLERSRDPQLLRRTWGETARTEFLAQAGDELLVDGLTSWSFGVLPEQVELAGGIAAFPAVVDQENSIGIRCYEDAQSAADHHRYGLRRLVELTLRDKFRYLRRALEIDGNICLQYASVDSCEQLRQDLLFAVSMAGVDDFEHPVRDAARFTQLSEQIRGDILSRANRTMPILRDAMARLHALNRVLDEDFSVVFSAASRDIRNQLDYLVYPGFLTEVTLERLTHYPRYLQALEMRIERLQRDPARDNQRQDRIASFWHEYLERVAALQDYPRELDEFHWLLEEYRVSLFAQELKTAQPISSKRLKKAWLRVPLPR